MAMAQEGANGNTACQMQTALNLNSNAAARQQAFQSLISAINSPGKSYTLYTANNLWPQVGFPILSSYVNVLQTDYFAGVTDVNFASNPTGTMNTINGAVSQETQGYIPTLFTSPLSTTTKLVLTNAIYFQGSWQNQFPVSFTAPATFTLESGATESVSMMNESINANIGNFNGTASVIAIPYTNSQASMYVFLPPAGGMAALESAMTGANINAWLTANSAAMTAASYQQVNLSLPKFTFSTNYNMTSTLSSLGMPLAFTQGEADFSGIDGSNDLFISEVVHQAYVDVSETGTVAAAATGVGLGVEIVMVPTYFTVNQPFIFMIVDNTSNVVLFMGRVDDPLSTN